MTFSCDRLQSRTKICQFHMSIETTMHLQRKTNSMSRVILQERNYYFILTQKLFMVDTKGLYGGRPDFLYTFAAIEQ